MNALSAVIFDVDGLMLDTEAVGLITWTQACKDLGYQMTHEIFAKMVGRNTNDSNEVCFQAFGRNFPAAEVRRKKVEYGKEYIAKHGLKPKLGLLELLADLRNLKLKIGIATSTDRPLALERLNISGITKEKYDEITCGNEVVNGKPAPDIFLEAARRINAQPSQCVVLEDSEAGIRGAFDAGMIPIMVPDLNQPSAEARKLAHRVVPSLVEAHRLIREMSETGR